MLRKYEPHQEDLLTLSSLLSLPTLLSLIRNVEYRDQQYLPFCLFDIQCIEAVISKIILITCHTRDLNPEWEIDTKQQSFQGFTFENSNIIIRHLCSY